MTKFAKTIRAFVRDEDGIALTEYLVFLGLLVGGVIAAVAVASGSLSNAWDSWSSFFSTSASCTNNVLCG